MLAVSPAAPRTRAAAALRAGVAVFWIVPVASPQSLIGLPSPAVSGCASRFALSTCAWSWVAAPGSVVAFREQRLAERDHEVAGLGERWDLERHRLSRLE